MRTAAFVIVVAMLVPSVSRIVCGWECKTERPAGQSATCHEQGSGDADRKMRGLVTTCHEDRTPSLTRAVISLLTSAPIALADVLFHHQSTVSSRTFVAINASAPPGQPTTSIQLRI